MTEEQYIEMKKRGREFFSTDTPCRELHQLKEEELNNILKFPYNSYETIVNWQLKRISELVDYAYMNIPLYKRKYDKIGYKLGSIKSWDDYKKLPILYKEELIDGFPNDIVKKIDDFTFSTRSSGSSGKFVTLAVSLEAIYKDTLQGLRQYYIQSNYTYNENDKVLFIYTCPWWFDNVDNKFQSAFLPTTTKIEETIKFIKKYRPKIISTYPTILQKISDQNVDLSKYGINTVIVHSEQSNLKLREFLGKRLGVNVVDEYSSEELTRIALECPNHLYHLEEDACYIEIVDPITKENLEYGQQGVVVGTNLLNTSTPIIRYFQGDLAILEEHKKCCCGSNCRTMRKIEGRYMDSIIISDDNFIPASSFMDIAYNWFLEFDMPVHGLKYQFIQNNINSLDVYLIKGNYKIKKDVIRKSLYQLLPLNMKVNIHVVNQLPNQSLKYRPVICNVERSKYEKSKTKSKKNCRRKNN